MTDTAEIDLDDLQSLHSPGPFLEEKNYELQPQQEKKITRLINALKIKSERKKTILKVAAILLAIVVISTVLLSSTFGAGFGIGYAVNGGSSDNNNNNNKNNDDENYNVEYDYYQGYPYVYRSPSDYQLDRSNPAEADLIETNEYQFKLNTNLFKDRMKGVRQLTDLLQQVLNITINEEDAEEDCFTETQYLTTDCGTIEYSELRIRSYVGGKLDQVSESDINKDSSPHESKENAMSYNLTPNPNYDNEQKIEQGISTFFF